MPTFTTDAVPVTWRLLTAKPGRVLAGALGIGSALMLILLLTGLWVGVQDRVTTYEDHTGAQLAVVAPGTESLFADPGRAVARQAVAGRSSSRTRNGSSKPHRETNRAIRRPR